MEKFRSSRVSATNPAANSAGAMTEVAEAQTLILERMARFPARETPLDDCAGAVLRETVHAERDQPPFDRVTMDGIAIDYGAWQAGRRRYRVAGIQGAGAPAISVFSPAECVEIMTGAMLPRGTDTVIPVERVMIEGGEAAVRASAVVSRHQFVHPRGSDRAAGSRLLGAGQRIGPAEVAILAGAGRTSVRTAAPPRVAVVSTGDELVEAGEPIQPYQIRSSNDRAIEAALVRRFGARVTRASLKDDPTEILESIARLHDRNDVVVLTGGVSMGKYDFVPGVLERLGVELVFHRIEQRPGRPMWFGVSKASKPVFALPGNPVSTLVCLIRYVVPALWKAMGADPETEEWVRLAREVKFSADLVYFLPVTLRAGKAGTLTADPRPTNTSGDYVALGGTDGFIELPRGTDTFPEGTPARLFRW